MRSVDEVLAKCTNILLGHGPDRPIKTILQELADGLNGDELPDHYGQGAYIAAFEAEIAALFGKEAAVFMPSGTMAQQIALRIWCERQKNFTVAMHPSAHLERAEFHGYQFLHNIRRLAFSAPEFLGSRMLTAADLDGLGAAPGAVLLELPYRPLGGELPPWDDLLAMRAGPPSAASRSTWMARASGAAARFTRKNFMKSAACSTVYMFLSIKTWADCPARCCSAQPISSARPGCGSAGTAATCRCWPRCTSPPAPGSGRCCRRSTAGSRAPSRLPPSSPASSRSRPARPAARQFLPAVYPGRFGGAGAKAPGAGRRNRHVPVLLPGRDHRARSHHHRNPLLGERDALRPGRAGPLPHAAAGVNPALAARA
jgi:hypothetical protein